MSPPDSVAAAPAGQADRLPGTVDGWALFLDVDGTLIDIAPTPDAVVVAEGLPALIARLVQRAGGALALVTGRSIATVDHLFAPERLPVAGVHGSEIRFLDGSTWEAPRPATLDGIADWLRLFVAATPGLLLEDKGRAVAVHYRAAPDQGEAVERELHRLAESADGAFAVQHGKMVVELRPATAHKGHAVDAFMDHPAFAGRRPLAIGDDLTDEGMFATVNQRGGLSVLVGNPERKTLARVHVDGTASVRSWLSRLDAEPISNEAR